MGWNYDDEQRYRRASSRLNRKLRDFRDEIASSASEDESDAIRHAIDHSENFIDPDDLPDVVEIVNGYHEAYQRDPSCVASMTFKDALRAAADPDELRNALLSQGFLVRHLDEDQPERRIAITLALKKPTKTKLAREKARKTDPLPAVLWAAALAVREYPAQGRQWQSAVGACPDSVDYGDVLVFDYANGPEPGLPAISTISFREAVDAFPASHHVKVAEQLRGGTTMGDIFSPAERTQGWAAQGDLGSAEGLVYVALRNLSGQQSI